MRVAPPSRIDSKSLAPLFTLPLVQIIPMRMRRCSDWLGQYRIRDRDANIALQQLVSAKETHGMQIASCKLLSDISCSVAAGVH